MTNESLDELRVNLSVKSKNGLDFTLSAGIIWIIIAWIWKLDFKSYDKSVFTFIIGALMMPLAFLFSKLFKTTWTNKDNPLQPLGLFNFFTYKIPGLFCHDLRDNYWGTFFSICLVL